MFQRRSLNGSLINGNIGANGLTAGVFRHKGGYKMIKRIASLFLSGFCILTGCTNAENRSMDIGELPALINGAVLSFCSVG